MSRADLIFISFEKHDSQFIGFLSISSITQTKINQQKLINDATKIYKNFVSKTHKMITSLYDEKRKNKFISARSIWLIGEGICHLTSEISDLGLQIDGLYEHLIRDLGQKRMWLEKVIIFRTYVENINLIPEMAKWSEFRDSPKKNAQLLLE